MKPVRNLNFVLFNIEGYGEFFSGITPLVRLSKEEDYLHIKHKASMSEVGHIHVTTTTYCR